jgi:large subunit ribosomal protein L22
MVKTDEKQNTPQLVKAFARDLRISPRKLRLVANAIKGKQIGDALTQLQFMNKKGAPMVIKLLKSAIANAENNFSLSADQLYIKSINCDMGKVMRRYFPRARGSAAVIRRKMAHVSVVLEPRATASKKSRFAMLSRPKKTEAKVHNVTQEEVPGKEAAQEKPIHERRVKTNESIKANKIQQKRRLFNRKSGE